MARSVEENYTLRKVDSWDAGSRLFRVPLLSFVGADLVRARSGAEDLRSDLLRLQDNGTVAWTGEGEPPALIYLTLRVRELKNRWPIWVAMISALGMIVAACITAAPAWGREESDPVVRDGESDGPMSAGDVHWLVDALLKPYMDHMSGEATQARVQEVRNAAHAEFGLRILLEAPWATRLAVVGSDGGTDVPPDEDLRCLVRIAGLAETLAPDEADDLASQIVGNPRANNDVRAMALSILANSLRLQRKWPEAIAASDRAIELVQDEFSRGQLLHRRGACKSQNGDLEGAEVDYGMAIESLHKSDRKSSKDMRSAVLIDLSELHRARGEHKKAIDMAWRARDAAREAGRPDYEAGAIARFVYAATEMGREKEEIEKEMVERGIHLDDVVALAKRCNDSGKYSNSSQLYRAYLATIPWNDDRANDRVRALQECVATAERSRDLNCRALAYMNTYTQFAFGSKLGFGVGVTRGAVKENLFKAVGIFELIGNAKAAHDARVAYDGL